MLFGEAPQGLVDDPLASAKSRKEAAVADLRELQLSRLRGEVLTVQEVEAKWTAIAGTIRERVLSLPDKLAPQVSALTDDRQVRELLRSDIRSWLDELADEVTGVA